MASITIRSLDDSLKSKLRLRAAEHGNSMESEAREILRSALSSGPPEALNLWQVIRSYIEPTGGVNLTLPKRKRARKPPTFS